MSHAERQGKDDLQLEKIREKLAQRKEVRIPEGEGVTISIGPGQVLLQETAPPQP